MRQKLLIILFIIISILVISGSSLLDINQEIPYGCDYPNRKNPISIINRNSDTLISLFYFDYNLNYLNYILKYNGVYLEFVDSVVGVWITGSGDFDSDGKLDIMGINPADSHMIVVMEQENEDSIYKDWTWKLAMTGEFHCYGVTDLIKTDGVDRMYGAPNPNTTVSDPYGWWYMECIGDNDYEIAYQDTTTSKTYAMDFGYIDSDSLLDVIAGRGGGVWEANTLQNDSFHTIGVSWGGGYYNEIIGDIDKDGQKEFILGAKVYDQSPAEWQSAIVECKDDNTYDTIWSHWIRKDYGPGGSIHSGCGGVSGDTDGDGDDELILCAGSIIEVFECVSNDSFELVWSMDNDTFAGSSVITHDFNGNGIDEIVWSGRSDQWLPYTYGIDMMKTYIIEWRRLWSKDSVFFSNSESGDTLYRYMWITNRGDTSLNIDSVGFDSKEFKQDTSITYPLTLDSNDSIGIRCSFYSDSEGVYGGKGYVYGDKSRYEVDMMGGSRIKCLIDSIVGYDGGTVGAGIDEDDYVIVYFAGSTNQADIDTSDIDNILKLSSGHTWGDVESADWLFRLNGHDRLRVNLSTTSGIPDISVGDTVYPDSSTITELLMDVPCHDATVIRGSFGPSGINTQTEGAVFDLSFKGLNLGSSIFEYTTYTKDTRVEVYDITGRNVLSQKSSKIGSNTINLSHLKSGIYFIRLETPSEIVSKSLIQIF